MKLKALAVTALGVALLGGMMGDADAHNGKRDRNRNWNNKKHWNNARYQVRNQQLSSADRAVLQRILQDRSVIRRLSNNERQTLYRLAYNNRQNPNWNWRNTGQWNRNWNSGNWQNVSWSPYLNNGYYTNAAMPNYYLNNGYTNSSVVGQILSNLLP